MIQKHILFTLTFVLVWMVAIVRNQQLPKGTGLRIIEENTNLETSHHFVPLKAVDVQAHIVDFLAKVTVIQTFVNNRNHPIECVYTFPLDESAAVTEFRAEIDGRTIVAVTKPRDEALRDYQNGIKHGHTSFLTTEERADIFTTNVGNLGPGKTAIIKLTYLTELALEGESLRFLLPTTIAPRYVPSQDLFTKDGRPTDSVLNPPAVDKVPYRLSMILKLNMPSKIVKISSPSHPIEVSMEDTKAVVTLGTGVTELDSDIIVKITLQEPHKPRLWIETMEGETAKAMMLTLYPDLEKKIETPEKRQQLIFVVDVSGSMEGEKIAYVRDALTISLEELKRRSNKVIEKFGHTHYYFNIYTFSHHFTNLFAEPVAATEQNVKKALEFVKTLEANGGTELLQPLKHILDSHQDQSILLITDGEISNTDEVIRMVYEKRHLARVFTLGIGYGVSHHLVNGLARAGAGVSEFAIPGEQLKEKVLRQLQRALNSNSQKILTIEWPIIPRNDTSQSSSDFFSSPYELPILYENSRLIAYSIVQGDIVGDVKIKTLGGPPYIIPSSEFKYLVDDTIHKLAARSRIRDLEEGRSEYHQKKDPNRSTESSQSLHVEETDRDNKIKQEIIRLAVKYNLLSRETSFVAIDTSQINDPSKMEFKRIEIQKVKDFLSQPRTKFAFSYAFPHPQARMATLDSDVSPSTGQQSIFIQEMGTLQGEESKILFNVARLSLSVADVHGNAVPIIARNTLLPTHKSMQFTTSKDNQTSATIYVYEGESTFAKNNIFLGKLQLTGLQPLPAGHVLITIDISLDVNKNVVISATATSGNTTMTPLSLTLSLPKMDEDSVMNHLQQYWDEPTPNFTTPPKLPE